MEVNTRRDHRKHFRIAGLSQPVLGKIIRDRQGRFEINKIQNTRLESKYRERVLELEGTWKMTLLCTPGAGRAPGAAAPAGDSPPGLPAPLRSYFPGGFGAAGPAYRSCRRRWKLKSTFLQIFWILANHWQFIQYKAKHFSPVKQIEKSLAT